MKHFFSCLFQRNVTPRCMCMYVRNSEKVVITCLYTLHKTCENTGFSLTRILLYTDRIVDSVLYGRMRVNEKLYSNIFYAVHAFKTF